MDGASAFDEPSDAPGGSARATVLLSSGLVANLATQMTFATTLHEIATAWYLDASESGWIGGIYLRATPSQSRSSPVPQTASMVAGFMSAAHCSAQPLLWHSRLSRRDLSSR